MEVFGRSLGLQIGSVEDIRPYSLLEVGNPSFPVEVDNHPCYGFLEEDNPYQAVPSADDRLVEDSNLPEDYSLQDHHILADPLYYSQSSLPASLEHLPEADTEAGYSHNTLAEEADLFPLALAEDIHPDLEALPFDFDSLY